MTIGHFVVGLIIYSYLERKKSHNFVNVHRVINMSKETVYHLRYDDFQFLNSMYELTERDRKLKPGWKVLVGGLCTLAMLLECTNVALSSQRENTRSTMICAYQEFYPSERHSV